MKPNWNFSFTVAERKSQWQFSINNNSELVYQSGLCKYSAGLKVRNFQLRTKPIRLFNISNFPSIVENELTVLQRRTAVELPTETRIKFTFCYAL